MTLTWGQKKVCFLFLQSKMDELSEKTPPNKPIYLITNP